MQKTIHYGMGVEYLSNWTLAHALREIYQNFLDYGNYSESFEFNDDLRLVTLTNDWQPESLDFLRIGRSVKHGNNAIGKHGEGIKMAFLILHRLGYGCKITTNKYIVWPDYYGDQEIGQCFCLKYEEHGLDHPYFTIEFECDAKTHMEYRENIIRDSDILYDDKYYGQIVNKPAGSIYSGRLFVANVKNISKAYNINPAHMHLDRDRMVPGAFDTNFATSKIQESQGKWTAKDTTFSDTQYISTVTEEVKKEFKPTMINKKVEFVYKDDKGEKQILQNNYIKEVLKKDNFFQQAITKLKKYVAKKLGLYDMVLEFKQNYDRYLPEEAKLDLDEIINKVSNN